MDLESGLDALSVLSYLVAFAMPKYNKPEGLFILPLYIRSVGFGEPVIVMFGGMNNSPLFLCLSVKPFKAGFGSCRQHNTMRKRCFVLSFMLMWILSATPHDIMLLSLKNGENLQFELESFPTIVFEGSEISVGNGVYSISDVSKYTFASRSSLDGISNNPISVTMDENGFLIIGNISTIDSDIHIYSLDGISYPAKIRTVGPGGVTIDMKDFQAGYYIIGLGGRNFKIYKR